MKKNYYLLGAFTAALMLASFTNLTEVAKIEKYQKGYHFLNGAGSPGNYTGAPSTANCTSCHNGTVQSGIGMNTVVLMDGANAVTQYTPNTTYNVVINMATANGKNGFQIVPLTTGNAMAGTIAITDGTNTKTLVTGGKTTVTHKSSGTALSTWTFQWTAPATNVGAITFYLATNVTNSNNNDTGDVIYTSQHVFGSQAGIVTNGQEISTEVSFNKANNLLNLEINTAVSGDAAVNIVDFNGKSVQFEKLGKVTEGENQLNVRLTNELPAGMYVVHVNVNNNYTSKKIYIAH